MSVIIEEGFSHIFIHRNNFRNLFIFGEIFLCLEIG